MLVIYTLRFIDAPTALVYSGAVAGIGALLFALRDRTSWLWRRSVWFTGSIALLGTANLILANHNMSPLELAWMNGGDAMRPIYEKWNSFSRVVVQGDPEAFYEPFAWGLSTTYRGHAMVRQLSVRIDAGAQTAMTRYDGDLRKLDYLHYDITNFAHYFRPSSQVLVIGAGGGRDVLSALAFGQKSVIAIEMNEAILQALNQKFGDFSGHLDRDPRVRFVHDEARSYIAHMPDRVDIIQASLVDTWAATNSGAYALAENGIYTTEAWRLFLDHLTHRGLLTFTRWYNPQYPAETYRLVALATTALARFGVEDARRHIIIVKCPAWPGLAVGPADVATILVAREPFSPADLDLLRTLTDRLKFEIVLSPRQAADPIFAKLASQKDLDWAVRSSPGRLMAPTDDSPFFFCNFGVREVFRSLLRWHSAGSGNAGSAETLGAVFVGIIFLTVLCLVVPWFLTRQNFAATGAAPLFFFAAIGLGYMLVEVSQLQRLMIFLGHPTYSLSTVLFTLLLSSGLGSFSTVSSRPAGSQLGPIVRLLGLLVVLALFGLLTPHAVAAFASAGKPVRILVAAGILFPLGFFMGMAFPLGMKAASAREDALTPWLWGLNGAASVLASVVAFLVVLGSGISAAFWTGFACYWVAVASYLWTVPYW
jgi:predicted membrane-bound spermidine synthase